jgi:type IV secretory pathway VirD2 relaxase
MSRRNDDRFELRPRPPRSSGGPGVQSFARRVTALVRGGGGRALGSGRSRSPTSGQFGRGGVAAHFAGRNLGPRSRRVVVKMRLVRLNSSTSQGVARHLNYIARDGVNRDGATTEPYDAAGGSADLRAFENRSQGDRHQFRFVVAPEDADQLEDLRPYTRALMQRMESDLGTRLDWVAVDHWDTDNPHTHLVLRGKDDAGRDLVIAPDYVGHGMRRRACEIATEWLGPRTDRELREVAQRQVTQERWTDLDRVIQRSAEDGVVSLAPRGTGPTGAAQRLALIGRLQHLERLGLAQPVGPLRWVLRHNVEEVLRTAGERGDIVRTLQRAIGAELHDAAIFDPRTAKQPLVGRLAAKRLEQGVSDRSYMVVEALDGRTYYVRLPKETDVAELPLNGIVEAQVTRERSVDRNIVNATQNGIYRSEHHAARLRAGPRPPDDVETIVTSHVRRLEALRRGGVVERFNDGSWRVPDDLVARGKAYDRKRLGDVTVRLTAHLPVERQVNAVGATWLDRQLVAGTYQHWSNTGFAAQARAALDAREMFHVEHGLASRRGSKIVVAADLLDTLRSQELQRIAQAITDKTGLPHHPVRDGESASGVLRRSLSLNSGRFAMLEDGLGFRLVPWNPVLEHRIGQSASAVVRGGVASWRFGRDRSR